MDMAKIIAADMPKLEKARTSVHGVVPATYSCFEKNGQRYFQIDTYGAPDRMFEGKISQSLQFDERSAWKLVELIASEFAIPSRSAKLLKSAKKDK